MSQLEDLFAFQLKVSGISFKREVRLLKDRRFRWDFVIGDLAIECQGSVWKANTGHSSGRGISRDCEKGFEALKAGFRPLCITGDQIKSGIGLKWVLELINLPTSAK